LTGTRTAADQHRERAAAGVLMGCVYGVPLLVALADLLGGSPWAMLGLAFLSVTAAVERAQPPPPGLIPLTRNEIAWLLEPLIAGPAHDLQHRIHWS
jgi:hypothetical protein